MHHTNNTFSIIKQNMLNPKSADTHVCDSWSSIWHGEFSYIRSVKWSDFIASTELLISAAIDGYDIHVNLT